MKKILIIAQMNGAILSPLTRRMVTGANKLGSEIEVLIAGKNCSLAAKEASLLSGVSKVLISEDNSLDGQLAEPLASLISSISINYDALIAASTAFGKNLMPRIAALLDIAPISEVIEIISPGIYRRPLYAGNAIATVQSFEKPQILTLRAGNFPLSEINNSPSIIEFIPAPEQWNKTTIEFPVKTSEANNDLNIANIVIAGGRGLKDKDKFQILKDLAQKLGAAVGASRAAVDSGYIGNESQIGQTGKIIMPNLYIAFGISGAVQHIAGIRDSGIIVAINIDENAPIFKTADYFWVTDLFKAIPELENEILQLKKLNKLDY